jgi:hypothetical protein
VVTLTGTVVRFALENAHLSVVLRVDDGTEWFVLLPSADGLARRALPPSIVDVGRTITVKGYVHKREPLHMRPERIIQDGVERSLRDARPPFKDEADEDWVLLGTKLHGGFGSYVALGVYIGLDAREQLAAAPRTLEVTLLNGPEAPCPCIADGLQLATGATPGRGLLRVETGRAPEGTFGVVTVTARDSGRALRYTIPGEVRKLLDGWNKLPPGERLSALRTVPAAQLFERVEVARRPGQD